MSVTLVNSSLEYDWRRRPITDFYPTPDNVTQSLINFLNLDTSNLVWEPACGQGHMVKVFLENGFKVKGTDIQQGIDFLTQTKLLGDWIITNPPFVLAESFIRKSYELQPKGFAFLLKSQYWHATKRKLLFDTIRPSFVLPLTWRPDFLFGKKGGAPTMEVLWTVWIKNLNQNTVYQLLERPK